MRNREKTMGKFQIRLLISVIVALACALLIPKVNVNSDMTKYLPDSSRMKSGLDILSSEFGQSASAAMADVRIMMEGVDSSDIKAIGDNLADIEGVDAVSITEGEGHTLYELNVAKSVNQKRLASKIKSSYPEYNCVSQTSQDGNTPDPKALVFAVICLAIILIIMSRSYLEPVLFLATTGMAVAVNMGTNAFLSSVSITTHSIAAVLQLALSMDYSIILMNRFRQQKELCRDMDEAMKIACKKAAPAILSSSLTTMVGLMVLAFMNLKIGADLGIVLAKGVLCSLIYAYVALPGLILLCNKGIKATEKKVPVPDTDSLAAFARKFRIPLTVLFVALFGLSYYFSTKTPITFSTSTPSEIDKVFPKKNAVVMLYENERESEVSALLDSLEGNPRVESVFSYPTLLKKKLDADAMVDFLKEQAGGQADMLTPEIMQVCYYAVYGDKNLKISFTDLVDFVTSQAKDNPLLASVDIPGLDEKLEMLSAIREISEPLKISGPKGPAADEEAGMTVREYMERLDAQQNTADTRMLLSLSDVEKLHKKMDVEEMTSFMGSTPTQTRMVYSFSKSSKEGMTPLEFAHFLTDDLFARKSLAKMVSKEQKQGMISRTKIMDAAASGAVFSKEELDDMVYFYGLKTALKDEAPEVMEQKDTIVVAPVPEEVSEMPEEVIEPVTTVEEEDPQMALLEKMLTPGRKYTAAVMSRNFRLLGEDVDEFTLSLLYMFYGSKYDYNPEWKMDLEQLVGFIGEDIMGDERFKKYLPEDIVGQFGEMKSGLQEGVAALKGPDHSIAAIITDYPEEAPETESFVRSLGDKDILIGESVMLCEMKDGFVAELRLVTILTILAIFAIVAISFRSLIVAAILVMTVMTSVFVNVASCGIGGGSDLYLAYLIVQSILMGATIDYGILFTTYYRENYSLKEAYRGSIHTILTSGLIICCVTGAMALFLNDAMIRPIVQNLSIGSFAAMVMILFVMPGVLSLVFSKREKASESIAESKRGGAADGIDGRGNQPV